MNLKNLISKIAFILFGSLILVSSVSFASACSMIMPDKVEDIIATGWYAFSPGLGQRITNLDEYVQIFSIPDQCIAMAVYIKSWIFYSIVSVIALIMARIILKRFRKSRNA